MYEVSVRERERERRRERGREGERREGKRERQLLAHPLEVFDLPSGSQVPDKERERERETERERGGGGGRQRGREGGMEGERKRRVAACSSASSF